MCRKGRSLDYARELAEEAGYLPTGSMVRDLLDAIDNDIRGIGCYPAHELPDYDCAETCEEIPW